MPPPPQKKYHSSCVIWVIGVYIVLVFYYFRIYIIHILVIVYINENLTCYWYKSRPVNPQNFVSKKLCCTGSQAESYSGDEGVVTFCTGFIGGTHPFISFWVGGVRSSFTGIDWVQQCPLIEASEHGSCSRSSGSSGYSCGWTSQLWWRTYNVHSRMSWIRVAATL